MKSRILVWAVIAIIAGIGVIWQVAHYMSQDQAQVTVEHRNPDAVPVKKVLRESRLRGEGEL